MKKQKLTAITAVFAVIILALYFSLVVGLTILLSNLQIFKYVWLIGFMTILSAILLIYLGLEFYSLRLFVPAVYGVLEICVALLSIILISNSFDIKEYLGTFSALYIIVRGLDNIHKHYGKIYKKDKDKDKDKGSENEEEKNYWIKRAVNKKLVLACVFGFMSNYVEKARNEQEESTKQPQNKS